MLSGFSWWRGRQEKLLELRGLVVDTEIEDGAPGASSHDFKSGLQPSSMWPVGVYVGHTLKLHFSDLWREDTGAYRGELVEGVTKVIQLRHSTHRGPSTSSGITVKCLTGSKVAWNLCRLLPSDYLLSGAHPAYVLFVTEDFTTLERSPNWRWCVCQQLWYWSAVFIHGDYPNGWMSLDGRAFRIV